MWVIWWLALHEKLVAWYLEEELMTCGILEGNRNASELGGGLIIECIGSHVSHVGGTRRIGRVAES